MRKTDIKYIENRLNEQFYFSNIKIKLTLRKGTCERNQVVTISINNKKYMIIIEKSIVSYGHLLSIFSEKICEVLANGRD